MAFIRHEKGNLVYHTASALALPGVRHGFSTRLGGVSEGCYESLNLRGAHACADCAENVAENYRRFCATIGTDAKRVVLAKQVHEATVRVVTEEDAGKGLWQPIDYTADALVTNVPGLPLVTFSADCIVILLADPIHGAVGAIHAGWRGTALQILPKAVETMVREYGTKAADLHAAIGAGIGSCCFETHDDVPEAMLASIGELAKPYMERVGEKWRVDLKEINAALLRREGVMEENIDICPLCTACHPELYWSHRKMGDSRGVQAAMIMKE